MKKRYFVFLIMLVSFFWICGTKISACAEEQISIEQKDTLLSEYDTLLSEFMREDDLPNVLIPKDCDVNLVYDDGRSSFSSDSVYMIEKYGFGVNVYHFKDAHYDSYLYLNIVFSDNAKFGSDDSLLITLPAGVGLFDKEIKGRWAQWNPEVEWMIVKDFTISRDSGTGKTIRIPLNQIVPGEYATRLLLSIHGEVIDEVVEGFQGMTVIWQHDPLNNSVNYDVPTPSVTMPGKSMDWKKIAVLAIILTLDLIVAVVVYLKLKHHPKKTNDSFPQSVELSDEKALVWKEELKSNLKLENEDMEYLKSIGYFDSKSSTR